MFPYRWNRNGFSKADMLVHFDMYSPDGTASGFLCKEADFNETLNLIKKIYLKNDPTLKDLYPNKNLRTCVMLLDMESQFVKEEQSKTLNSYPFYRGSKSLSSQYGELSYEHYFHFDKKLQDEINERLKTELIAKGIKNKNNLIPS